MLLRATVDFVWLGGGGVCTVIHFHIQPNYNVEVVLWLCCVVVRVVKIVIALIFQHSLPIPVIVLANNYNCEFKLAPQSLV